jgi:hypothetical protein
VLKQLKVLRALAKNKRHHELLDPMPFLEQVTQLVDAEKPKSATRKTTGKTATKKAAVKKKSMARTKTAKSL